MEIHSSRFGYHAQRVSRLRYARRFAACLVGAVLVSALAGCQSGMREPATTSSAGGAISSPGGQVSGSGQSGTDDYRKVLADPGPF
jgi:hypothetical protein